MVWYDRWCEHGPLCLQVPYVHVSDTTLRVMDVFHDGACDFRRLLTPLSSVLVQRPSSLCIIPVLIRKNSLFGPRRWTRTSRWLAVTVGFKSRVHALSLLFPGLGFGRLKFLRRCGFLLCKRFMVLSPWGLFLATVECRKRCSVSFVVPPRSPSSTA